MCRLVEKQAKAESVAEQCVCRVIFVRDSDAKSLTCNFLFGNSECDGILMRIKGLLCDFSRGKGELAQLMYGKATSNPMSCDNDRFRIAFNEYRSIPLSICCEKRKTC